MTLTATEKAALLDRVDLFAGLGGVPLEAIAEHAPRGRVRDGPADRSARARWAPASSSIVSAGGARSSRDGSPIAAAQGRANSSGSCRCSISSPDRDRHAIEPTTCLAIASWDSEQLLDQQPRLAVGILRAVVRRLRAASSPAALSARTGRPIDRPSALPVGTVTLLFTDIEGSTRLLQRSATRTAPSSRRTTGCSGTGRRRHGGVVFGTEGDALSIVFRNASGALAAAVAAQRALAAEPGRTASRSASGWACTRARSRWPATPTSASTSIGRPGSRRPATAARCWSRHATRAPRRAGAAGRRDAAGPRRAPPEGPLEARAHLPARHRRACGPISRRCGRSTRSSTTCRRS